MGSVEPRRDAELTGPPAEHRRTSVHRGIGLERALLGMVVLVALGIRLPHLTMVPQFTDESLEVLWSMPILRGESFPLTNYDAYYGALFNYLVAASFALLGPSALAARLVVLVAAVLTVLATYALGRAWGGPAAGLLAAALLATSAAHVVINSHIAWANCTTPLFTTLAIWTLYRAVVGSSRPPASSDREGGRRSWSGALFPLSGLLWGLALQTHPMVVTLLPGAAAFVLWKGRTSLRTPWPYLAVLAFMLGYGNMLLHNLNNGLESLTSAQRIQGAYTTDDDAAASYPAALAAELLLLGRALAGAVDAREAPWGFLLDPALLLAVLLALLGLGQQARRGNPLPLLLVVSCLLLLPAINPKFRTLISSRYIMPLLPVMLAAVAVFLTSRLSPGAKPLNRVGRWTLSSGPVVRLAALGALLVVLLAPFPSLSRYYERAYRTGETNERAYAVAELVTRAHRPGEPLVLDESFGSDSGGVSELRAVRYLLAFQGIEVRVIKITAKRLEAELENSPGLLVMLTRRQFDDADRLPLELLSPPPRRSRDIGLYRLETPGPDPAAGPTASAFFAWP